MLLHSSVPVPAVNIIRLGLLLRRMHQARTQLSGTVSSFDDSGTFSRRNEMSTRRAFDPTWLQPHRLKPFGWNRRLAAF